MAGLEPCFAAALRCVTDPAVILLRHVDQAGATDYMEFDLRELPAPTYMPLALEAA